MKWISLPGSYVPFLTVTVAPYEIPSGLHLSESFRAIFLGSYLTSSVACWETSLISTLSKEILILCPEGCKALSSKCVFPPCILSSSALKVTVASYICNLCILRVPLVRSSYKLLIPYTKLSQFKLLCDCVSFPI